MYPQTIEFNETTLQLVGLTLRQAAALQVLGAFTQTDFFSMGDEKCADRCWEIADAFVASMTKDGDEP